MERNCENNKTMSVKEFCAEYKIGINKAYEIVNSKDFPMVRLGRKILIIRPKIDSWLESQIGRTF